MTQEPFSGNDIFDQVDSVARNLTGNQFRLRRGDPDAPQKFTEFLAQTEQEFQSQAPQPTGIDVQPQAAQPEMSFQEFQENGFDINPAGQRRADILAGQQAQSDASGASLFDETIGRGVGALGRGALGFGRANLELEEQIRQGTAGLASEVRPLVPGVRETEFDLAFQAARESGLGLQEAFAAASQVSEQTPFNAGEFFNPFINPAAGPSAGAPGGAPVDFTLGTADVASELINPVNFLPVIGDPGLITKPLQAAGRGARRGGGAALDVAADVGAAAERAGLPSPVSVARAGVDEIPGGELTARFNKSFKQLEKTGLPEFVTTARAGREVVPELLNAVTGEPFDATLFRGFGRETIEDVFNPDVGAQINILGDGTYTTPNLRFAENFGPQIEELRVSLRNPLVIANDAQYNALAREAGLVSNAPQNADEAANFRRVIEAKGHDGVIVLVPESELTGKRLIQVFGDDTVVDFGGVRPDVVSGGTVSDPPVLGRQGRVRSEMQVEADNEIAAIREEQVIAQQRSTRQIPETGLADDAALRAIEDATPSQPADLPTDVTGGKPPTATVGDLPPSGADGGQLFPDLQDVQTNLDVAFNETVNAKLGRIIQDTGVGRALTGFNPAIGANNEGKRAVIALANSLEEGTLNSDRIISRIDEIGERRTLFNSELDEAGLFKEGEFKGLSLNEIREKSNLPIFKARMSLEQINYIETLGRLDEGASELLRRSGREVGFTDDEDILFASRRIYAKMDPTTGELIRAVPEPQLQSLLAKTPSEKARTVRTAEQLRKRGFVLLPYDQTVKLKIRQAYRVAAEANLAKFIRKNYDFVDPPSKKDFVESQKRLFKGQVPTNERSIEFVDDLNEALEQFSKRAPSGKTATTAAALNNFARSYELAGDASLFGIQLLGNIFEDLSPVAARGGLRNLGVKVPGKTMIPTSKKFASQFVRGLFSPQRARKHSARMIREATDEGLFEEARGLILLSSDNPDEFTESGGIIRNVNDYLRKKGGARKIAGKLTAIYSRPLEAFQEAFVSAMNTAGIQLWRALKPLTLNADGTVNPQLLRDVEDFINNSRGLSSSGRLGISPRRRWIEGQALLAPRYRRATAALYAQAAQGGPRGDLARNQITALITGLTMTMAAYTIGSGLEEGKSSAQIKSELKERLIPGSGSYMMADVLGQKVGFGSKFISDINFITKIIKNPSSLLEVNPENNSLIRWARGQGSFLLSTPIDFLMGRDVVGNVSRPGDPLFGGDTPTTREGVLALTREVSSLGIPIWVQSAGFEGGDMKQRLLRGSGEFLGSRAYQQGRSSTLSKASFERFGKPLEDLNQLERFEIQNDPQLAPVLAEFDDSRAAGGDKFANYRRTRTQWEANTYSFSQADLDSMITELSKGGSADAWNVLNRFADRIGENKGFLAVRMNQSRRENGLDGYVGEEPKNDFDEMLNNWYDLLDKHTSTVKVPGGEEKHRLDFDTWIPAVDKFIEELSPELQQSLSDWRERKQSPPGVEAILEARRPNEELYGLYTKGDRKGKPKGPNGKELFTAVTDIILGELGMTAREFNALRADQ